MRRRGVTRAPERNRTSVLIVAKEHGISIGYAYIPDRRSAPLVPGAQAQNEPIVRIGLNQNAATVTIRSASAFSVQQYRTRSATVTAVLSSGTGAAAATLKKSDLQYRMVVELDGGVVLALPPGTKVRMASSGAPLAIENRTYRGAIEVFGNRRNTLTVVNELPIEEYLLGVVPNELSPTTFGQIEALKAQAVAARTYVQRNLGQSKNEGYDICATDACQVYLGAGTEDPTASQAVLDTRGVVATFDGKPIDALYTSTCGGRTENSENIFDLKVPYLVSTSCEYKHPEPLSFSTSRSSRIGRRRYSPSPAYRLWRCAALHGPPGRGRAAIRRSRGASRLHPPDVLPVGDHGVRRVVSDRAGHPVADRRHPDRGSALPTRRQEGRLRMAAGRPGVVGREDDDASGQRPAEGVRARRRRTNLPAHR